MYVTYILFKLMYVVYAHLIYNLPKYIFVS